MPEPLLPENIRDEVLRELYRQVDTLDWEEVPPRTKTIFYTRWIEDDLIGGMLADYMTAEGMRVWLKDGPLKEYARAVEQFGPYAKYVSKYLTPPSEFVPRLLGTEWKVRQGTIGEKPMHCTATSGAEMRYLCWGRARNFRDLAWAALNRAIESPSRPVIVVYTTSEYPLEQERSRQFQLIAEHCRFDLYFVRRRWLGALSG